MAKELTEQQTQRLRVALVTPTEGTIIALRMIRTWTGVDLDTAQQMLAELDAPTAQHRASSVYVAELQAELTRVKDRLKRLAIPSLSAPWAEKYYGAIKHAYGNYAQALTNEIYAAEHNIPSPQNEATNDESDTASPTQPDLPTLRHSGRARKRATP